MGPAEVITSVQRRVAGRRGAMVEEAEQSRMSLSAISREYGVNPNHLFRWRRLLQEGALCAVGAEESVVLLSEVKELLAKIRELERLLGRKNMKLKILKDAVRIVLSFVI